MMIVALISLMQTSDKFGSQPWQIDNDGRTYAIIAAEYASKLRVIQPDQNDDDDSDLIDVIPHALPFDGDRSSDGNGNGAKDLTAMTSLVLMGLFALLLH